MDCRLTQQMIARYMKHDLEPEEMENFIQHVKGCSECYEELEIYYTIESGLRQLDSEVMNFQNLKNRLDGELYYAETSLKRHRRFKVFGYTINTLAFWGVIYSIALVLRILIMG